MIKTYGYAKKTYFAPMSLFPLTNFVCAALFFSIFFFDQKQSTLDLQIWDKYVLKYQIIQVLNPSKINVIPNNDKNWRSKVLKSHCPY